MKKERLFAIQLAILTMLVCFGLAEVLLRANHREAPRKVRIENEPTMFGPDPVLGWRTKPGTYRYAGYTEMAAPIHVTIRDDGSRATHAGPDPAGAPILLLGDSFTFGWAISDEETFAWKLQERMPTTGVLDYGASGYGTFQSLLLLEQLRAKLPVPPSTVLFGFTEVQEERNVGSIDWLRALSLYSRRGQVSVPFVLPGPDGALVRHPPESFPQWPLADLSAVVWSAEDATMRIRGATRVRAKREVTERLLAAMKETVEKQGARFAVVLLQASPEARQHYREVLAGKGIEVLDCITDTYGKDGYFVPGEGHPNGATHSLWARCIEDGLAGGRAAP
ncbi:MAG: SGNH/GDSL hydrolase family protein [Acidobacteriota bacterium]